VSKILAEFCTFFAVTNFLGAPCKKCIHVITHASRHVDWKKSCDVTPISPEVTRPPGTSVPGRAYILPQMFFFRHPFSEIPRPIALKLCHVVGMWLNFINWLQKFGGVSPPPKKNWGAKNMQNFGHFWTTSDFDLEYLRNEATYTHRKDVRTSKIPPAFNEKNPVNFGPLTAWNYMWVWTHWNALFWHTISQPLGGAAPWNFYTR